MHKLKNITTIYVFAFALVFNVVAHAKAAELPADTLKSTMWEYMAEEFILTDESKAKKIIMDEKVRVYAPKVAEDGLVVPVYVDATAITGVKKIIVLADLNPLPNVLTYEPIKSEAKLSFRVKLQQGSPIRAAVLDSNGVWHVGGTYVDAAGGGCTQPALAHGEDDWTARLAEVRAKVWRKSGKSASKMRFSIRHPMDTGLADGIPAFYVETLEVKDPKGEIYGRLQIKEPVSENPTLTLYPQLGDATEKVNLEGRDNEGNKIRVEIPADLQSSTLQLK